MLTWKIRINRALWRVRAHTHAHTWESFARQIYKHTHTLVLWRGKFCADFAPRGLGILRAQRTGRDVFDDDHGVWAPNRESKHMISAWINSESGGFLGNVGSGEERVQFWSQLRSVSISEKSEKRTQTHTTPSFAATAAAKLNSITRKLNILKLKCFVIYAPPPSHTLPPASLVKGEGSIIERWSGLFPFIVIGC